MKKENYAVSVDEFLTQQSDCELFATIEPVDDNKDLVKVTPWYPSRGCLCGNGINISKDSIESLHPTGDRHTCCGKVLRVAGVRFKEGATVELSQLFDKIAKSTAETAPMPEDSGFTSARRQHRVGAGPRPDVPLLRGPAGGPRLDMTISFGCVQDCQRLSKRFFEACDNGSIEGVDRCLDIADRLEYACIEGKSGFQGCYYVLQGLF